MHILSWRYFGYTKQDLVPFEPILAEDNLATLANYSRLCGWLFAATAGFHTLFGFFTPIEAIPLLAASGMVLLLRQAALSLQNDRVRIVLHSRWTTTLFTAIVYFLAVVYDVLQHPTEINLLVCLILLCEPLLFDSYPNHNLFRSALSLGLVVYLECLAPDPHRLTNLMYCTLATLLGLYLAWHKTRNMFGMLLHAQREREAVESEANMQAAVNQMQPHFICNMLSTLQQLCCYDEEETRKALAQFSDYMRVSTDALNFSGLVPFNRELVHVRTYAALEQLRFGDCLKMAYHIKTDRFFLPSLTLQPLVENAITHGLGSKPGGGTVTIDAWETTTSFCVAIHDDGCGTDIDPLAGVPPQPTSGNLNLANVQQRLRALAGGRLFFHSCINEGTTVTILLPKER